MSDLLLAMGILTISGVFFKKLTYTSSLIAPLLFTTLGLGRLISILTDGMPVDGLVKATGLELVLGVIRIILFKVYQDEK